MDFSANQNLCFVEQQRGKRRKQTKTTRQLYRALVWGVTQKWSIIIAKRAVILSKKFAI